MEKPGGLQSRGFAKSRIRLSDFTSYLSSRGPSQPRNRTQVSRIAGRRFNLVFPDGSDGKESTCNAGDLGSAPRLGRSPEGGHGNPLGYSWLENLMDRGAWQAAVHRVAELDMTE